MFLKILLTLIALMLAWLVLFRGLPGRRRSGLPDRPRNPFAGKTLEQCPKCGIYLPEGEGCDCPDRR